MMAEATDRLSMIFAALADPTRRAILDRLAEGEASVMELAEPFDISLPAISRHLKVLEEAGLVTRRVEAQYRPRQLDVRPLQEVDAWLERYRRYREESFDRLDEYLKQLLEKKNKNGEQNETDTSD